MDKLESEHLRKIILNAKYPLVIKNQTNCALLSWSLQDWSKVLANRQLQFRCGKNTYTENPQWESTCTMKQSNFDEFLQNNFSIDKEWWYFDYKYLRQWFTDEETLRKNIDWSRLGFPDISVDDSTIWIGSKGAHTPCHMDTYGCNMVLQIFGRKQWILFLPEQQNLRPTRIPFEESSVYSKLNFFSPNLQEFEGINSCCKIIVEPGDVLIVPNKWWHYVENLETAISINAWLPLPQDDFQRVKESIATIFVRKFTENQVHLQRAVLNPNMMIEGEMINCEEAANIIAEYKTCAVSSTSEENVDLFVEKFENIIKVPILSDNEFKEFLKSQKSRFSNVEDKCSDTNKKANYTNLINLLEVVLDDEVLDLIAKKLRNK